MAARRWQSQHGGEQETSEGDWHRSLVVLLGARGQNGEAHSLAGSVICRPHGNVLYSGVTMDTSFGNLPYSGVTMDTSHARVSPWKPTIFRCHHRYFPCLGVTMETYHIAVLPWTPPMFWCHHGNFSCSGVTMETSHMLGSPRKPDGSVSMVTPTYVYTRW